jgi:hypothetical protein
MKQLFSDLIIVEEKPYDKAPTSNQFNAMFRLWIVHVILDFLRCVDASSALTSGHKRRLLLAHQRSSRRLRFQSYHAVSYTVVTYSLKDHEEVPIIQFGLNKLFKVLNSHFAFPIRIDAHLLLV